MAIVVGSFSQHSYAKSWNRFSSQGGLRSGPCSSSCWRDNNFSSAGEGRPTWAAATAQLKRITTHNQKVQPEAQHGKLILNDSNLYIHIYIYILQNFKNNMKNVKTYYWNLFVAPELPAWKCKTARRWRAALQWMAFRGASWEWDRRKSEIWWNRRFGNPPVEATLVRNFSTKSSVKNGVGIVEAIWGLQEDPSIFHADGQNRDA